jgi:hypothetical protein
MYELECNPIRGSGGGSSLAEFAPSVGASMRKVKSIVQFLLLCLTVGFVLGALAGIFVSSKYRGIFGGVEPLDWGIIGFEVGGVLGILIVLVALAKGVDLDM